MKNLNNKLGISLAVFALVTSMGGVVVYASDIPQDITIPVEITYDTFDGIEKSQFNIQFKNLSEEEQETLRAEKEKLIKEFGDKLLGKKEFDSSSLDPEQKEAFKAAIDAVREEFGLASRNKGQETKLEDLSKEEKTNFREAMNAIRLEFGLETKERQILETDN